MSAPNLVVATPVSGVSAEFIPTPLHAADTAAATHSPRPGHWSFRRTLLAAASLLFTAIHPSASVAAPAIPPVREVAALYLTSHQPPALFFVDALGKEQPFALAMQGRGAVNRVPASGPLRLFTQAKDPATGQPVLKPALETPLPAGNAPALLAFYHGPDGAVAWRLIEDDPSRHLAGTVRLLNLSGQEVACKLDGQIFQLQPSDSRVQPVADPSAFIYVYGAREADGGIFQFPPNRLRVPRPDRRLLGRVATDPAEIEPGQRKLVVRDTRIDDRVAPPPAAPRSLALHP